MVEIGGRPILWHILKIYSHHGINDFVICCGYKGYLIKEYFANYFLHMSDVTFDMRENRMEVHQSVAEPWHVTLVDTGDNAGTGGRLKKRGILPGRRRRFLHDIRRWCERHRCCLQPIAFHGEHGKAVTVDSRATSRAFRRPRYRRNSISEFQEKPQGEGGWINGGFFVLSPSVFERDQG